MLTIVTVGRDFIEPGRKVRSSCVGATYNVLSLDLTEWSGERVHRLCGPADYVGTAPGFRYRAAGSVLQIVDDPNPRAGVLFVLDSDAGTWHGLFDTADQAAEFLTTGRRTSEEPDPEFYFIQGSGGGTVVAVLTLRPLYAVTSRYRGRGNWKVWHLVPGRADLPKDKDAFIAEREAWQ